MSTRIHLLKRLYVGLAALVMLGIGAMPLFGGGAAYGQIRETKAIAAFPDGHHQICSKPDPMDWRDGAGVCFNFIKTGRQIEGYYGYPHSDRFVCLRGTIDQNLWQGEGLTFSWSGESWSKSLPSDFRWDTEKRLRLRDGRIVRSTGQGSERIEWIRFRRASLDIKNFYRYRSPRMTAIADLCHW